MALRASPRWRPAPPQKPAGAPRPFGARHRLAADRSGCTHPPSGSQNPWADIWPLRAQDVVCVREGVGCGGDGPPWGLYCVCDGHKGTAAATHVKAHLWRHLEPLLPRGPLPDSDSEGGGVSALGRHRSRGGAVSRLPLPATVAGAP